MKTRLTVFFFEEGKKRCSTCYLSYRKQGEENEAMEVTLSRSDLYGKKRVILLWNKRKVAVSFIRSFSPLF